MLIGYGDYALTFAISGTGAAFVTDKTDMADGRTGTVTSMTWISGAQTTSSFVELTVTIDSDLDSTAAQGVVGVCNCSLPEGTKLVIAGVTQRLVKGERGELSAWVIPQTTGNTVTIRIYNDVNGAASIVASSAFAIGEIFVGRIMSVKTLLSSPSDDLADPTAYSRTDGGQLWQLMRKPYRLVAERLGMFTTAQAKGGADSDLVSGSNPAGVIDIRTLRGLLSTSNVCAVCDTPNAGQGDGTLSSGIRYDQDFMQTNWMLARMTNAGTIAQSNQQFWSWNPAFQEAT